MLEITLPAAQGWDESKEEFVYWGETTLKLEHSLVSISKWESKWNKPFLVNNNKTDEELMDYIKCMTVTPKVDPTEYNRLTSAHITQIENYIKAPMTATTFRKEEGSGGRGEIVTAELIYYWMIALNIPMKCEHWHLNRLLTLVRVCNIKNSPPKKANKRDIANRYAELNRIRRQKYGSKG